MANSRTTVRDFLGTLNYLMALCTSAQESDDPRELVSALPFIQGELIRAKDALERIELFKMAEAALVQVGKLVSNHKIHDADRLVLSLAIVLSELSGQNDAIRRQFGRPPKKKPS